eukprot:14841763-Alexandrium_andersonii.AAC.1
MEPVELEVTVASVVRLSCSGAGGKSVGHAAEAYGGSGAAKEQLARCGSHSWWYPPEEAVLCAGECLMRFANSPSPRRTQRALGLFGTTVWR